MTILSKGRRGPAGRAARSGSPRRCPGPALLLLAAALAAVLALAPPAPALAAQEGEVALGAEAAKRVEPPAPGDEGALRLGAAVGFEGVPAGDRVDPGVGGTVSIGAAIGYKVLFPDGWTATFDAGRGSFPDGSSVAVLTGPVGAALPRPPEPERAGWRFAGWHVAAAGPGAGWDPDGASAVPLGEEWDFSAPVAGDMTLYARWDLRLDVTVPVSVGFAVNAGTGEAEGPEDGRYALRSRTAAPVVVERAALESRQGELERFFEPKEGASWEAALREAELSLGAGGEEVALPFAGEAATVDGAEAWKSSHPLDADERAAFGMEPFDYGGAAFDEGWQGGIPCEELPLKLGLTVPIDELRVRTDLDGPQKVTRLVLTVSAKA